MDDVTLHLGDCLEYMRTMPDNSVDAVITDPPYPCINRDYGTMTEAEWWDMMMMVCVETRRILKPTGSAVFILQPNSRKVGSMRGWLWEFMAWVCREWNMVQDVWWWNLTSITEVLAIQGGMARPSVKACVWAGSPDCYHNQGKVLWKESESNRSLRAAKRFDDIKKPSGHHANHQTAWQAAENRGGVTPFNLLPIPHDSRNGAGANGHGAGTPLELAKWWTRYIVPPGGVVCDPFMGSGTMGLAAIAYGCGFVGTEKIPAYYAIAERRIREAQMQPPLIPHDAPKPQQDAMFGG